MYDDTCVVGIASVAAYIQNVTPQRSDPVRLWVHAPAVVRVHSQKVERQSLSATAVFLCHTILDTPCHRLANEAYVHRRDCGEKAATADSTTDATTAP